jgi:predicted nucleotidyltransferase
MKQFISDQEQAALRDLVQTAAPSGVGLMAVGASARQLVFDRPNNIPIYRTTTDWDFAVSVESWSAFDELRAALTQKLFRQDAIRPHRVIHIATGVEIDLVPFGGIEHQGRITWPDTNEEMNVTVFRDVFDKAMDVEVGPGLFIRAATPQLHVPLKVLAAGDRVAITDRDVKDLRHILANYPTGGRESELFNEPLSQARTLEHFDWYFAGPLLLGADLATSCNSESIEAILPTLEEMSNPYSRYIDKLVQPGRSSDDERKQREDHAAAFTWLVKGILLRRLDVS